MTPWQAECCSDFRPAVIEWLWPGYLARGKLATLDGDPAVGKSLLTIDLAARLGRSGPMPNGSAVRRPFTTLLLSAEDDPADTVRPRAEAAGADLDRLLLPRLGGLVPRFPDELSDLEDIVEACGAGLVVIDSLMAYLPPGVANVDQCVRQVLTPLAALAARTGCRVLLVRHPTKAGQGRAVYRGQGSLGIAAAARTGLYVGPHPTDPAVRVLAAAKTNVGRLPPALGFRVVEGPGGQPVVAWAGPVDVTADAVCRPGPAAGVRPRKRAADWLRRELSAGPRSATDLSAAATAAGIPETTLRRAKAELGVGSKQVRRDGGGREWYWCDPSAAGPAGDTAEGPRQQ